jgi:ATP-dependent helicase IRC3
MLLKSATIIRRPLFYSPFSKNHVLHLSARVSTKANATTTVKLRDYQEECIKDCLQALGRGRTRIGVSLPTGSGKTPVFVSLLHQIPHDDARPNATRSLIIVNSIELATQAAKQVKKMFPETSVEIEQGTNTASGNADV